eukprot:SAG11_NODE_12248_length_713_cov_1.258958_2_plen_51_part_01
MVQVEEQFLIVITTVAIIGATGRRPHVSVRRPKRNRVVASSTNTIWIIVAH